MKKVLIVDDEEDMIWSLQKNLPNSKLQVETLTASSGEEALEVLNQTAVDLIVTDIKMPGMSGLDLLSEVNSRYPDLEVIVMTAYSSQECQTEAIIRGGFSYIEKPFDINEMRKVISQALQGKGGTIHGEPAGEGINDISTLAMEIPAAVENESPDYIVKIPENVQAVLSEEGDIEDSIVNTLLNFSIEDLLNEDDMGNDDTVLANGRSIEDAIVESLIDVSEESQPVPTNRGTSPLENDEPTALNLETKATDDNESVPTSQETYEPKNDEPASTNLETSAPEENEPAESIWVINTRNDNESAESKWVINTRDKDEPEEIVQETKEPEYDEPAESKWVINTRDDYQPVKTKWVINTRDKYEPVETVLKTQKQENDEQAKTNWVIKIRED